MNAAYGSEIGDVITNAAVLDEQGGAHVPRCEPAELGYRQSGLKDDWIVLSAGCGAKWVIVTRLLDVWPRFDGAGESQPRTRTGGSVVNPPGAKAWELIDQAGCRGLRRGGAMVSEQHCNFLLNLGDATSGDLELLGEEINAGS